MALDILRRQFVILARCIVDLFSTQEIDRYRDITDLVLEDANSMKRELGYSDGQKFAEYFDSIRTIETQMDRLGKNERASLRMSLLMSLQKLICRGVNTCS